MCNNPVIPENKAVLGSWTIPCGISMGCAGSSGSDPDDGKSCAASSRPALIPEHWFAIRFQVNPWQDLSEPCSFTVITLGLAVVSSPLLDAEAFVYSNAGF